MATVLIRAEPKKITQVTAVIQPRTSACNAIAKSATDAPVSQILLLAAALALASIGIAMNGWFARSLGSSDAAVWLFFAAGVAADLIALVVPSCAARLWQARQRATSLAGCAVWAMTFVFAVTAGIGFASVKIADVTLLRVSRITPAVQTEQTALADAMVMLRLVSGAVLLALLPQIGGILLMVARSTRED